MTEQWKRASRLNGVGIVAAGLWIVASLTGCADPLEGHARKALETYRTVMNQNQDYKLYGLQIAAHSTAPETGAILAEGAAEKGYKVFSTALRGLIERPVPEAKETLQTAFAGKTGAAKLLAALALAETGDPEAAAWLKETAEKEKAATNPDVLVFLGNHGEKELAQLNLYRRLDSDDEYVRDEAFVAMGQIHEDWAAELLKNGLAREVGPRRKQAIISMGMTGRPELASEVARFVNTQGLVLASIETLGLLGNQEVVPKLQEIAGHEDPLVQVIAGVALLRLGDEETALPILKKQAASSDETVRVNLATQLNGVPGDAARELLTTLAADPSTAVARPALLALENDGDESLQPMVLEILSDSNPDRVMAALDCLGAWGDAEAADAIAPLLEGDNGYLRLTAANAILEIRARLSETA